MIAGNFLFFSRHSIILGLAGITPASGYISSQASIVVAIILGVASYFSCIFVKRVLKIDDALDGINIYFIFSYLQRSRSFDLTPTHSLLAILKVPLLMKE